MNDKHVVERELLTSNSRDPLNTTGNKSNVTKALAAITNNTKISDFFTISNKKRSTVKNALINETKNEEGVNENNVPILSTSNKTDTKSQIANRQVQSSAGSMSHDAHSAELELLKRKYDELKQECQDKEEQLKAVSNNRTILHTALQAALRQREQELDALQQSTDERNIKYRDALEELIRTDACQEARELREKLAVDGARLGRILSVPSVVQKGPPRMLMHHRSTIETWEDGYATKELQQKLKELQAKKVVLEARQVEASLAAEKYFAATQHDDALTSTSTLEVIEAVESVRYHLNNVRQQERELALAEQTLNDEKGAHVRALKRVASEDASRFRTRPKLNDRYVLRSLLGKGGFSEVWLAFDLVELREVAVKIHQLDSRWPDAKKDNYTKHVSREYEIHRSVRHPRIVSLFDVFEIDNNSFATVLELCEGTDLDTILKVKRRLPERDARAILLQILSGMNYLSRPSEASGRQGIIHYDLKPGNVLFDQYGDAKITDFGLSKIVDAHDPAESMELTSQGAGTYWYLPPECFVLEDSVRISNKVDVWSIGVIFYQMLFGKRPFGDGQSQDRMLTNGTMLHAHAVTFPERPEISLPCRAFIEACLTYDQRFRPSIAQICEHSYVVTRETFNKTE
jgi:tousled-like kinase